MALIYFVEEAVNTFAQKSDGGLESFVTGEVGA